MLLKGLELPWTTEDGCDKCFLQRSNAMRRRKHPVVRTKSGKRTTSARRNSRKCFEKPPLRANNVKQKFTIIRYVELLMLVM